MRGAAATLLLLGGCSFLLPTTWRSFSADPDDAPPAITRALDARNLQVAHWNQETHQIITDWVLMADGGDKIRQRFTVRWERDETEKALTIYVRHEAQDQELEDGRPVWGSTYHDTGQESDLLDEITKQLKAMQTPMTEEATTTP